MKKIRSLHLYLGCVFAPMLIFFAISGIWQTYDPAYDSHSKLLAMLSTIHTSQPTKSGTLSSAVLRDYVLIMATGFIITTILGVIMALKYDRSRRTAYGCLAFGVLFPLVAVLIKIL
ncbi:MAG TPA: hypothetical protein VMA13_03175 [Candidatus Saccharimonadales bacterium]|nr:hypothetical protein [Candidatus Saccharimonadales bacterium]